jgi:hypothetical protein
LGLSSSVSETIGFMGGSSYSIPTAMASNSTMVDIHKFYRVNMSFSFSKNDLALSSNASDFTVLNSNLTFLKFIASQQPSLKLYSNNAIMETVRTEYNLSSNVWYDFYATMKYDGISTSGEIFIGSNNVIAYAKNYNVTNFTPFRGIDSTLEVRIGVNKDESPSVLNKKIENINIFTKKLNRYTVNNIITTKAVAIVKPITNVVSSAVVAGASTVSIDILETWYLLNDFSGNTFNNIIKDSSGKGRDGTFAGTSPTIVVNTNNKNKSNYGLLKNSGKSMKVSSFNFSISTQALVLNTTFTVMIKVKLETTTSSHNIFKYNNLSVDMTNESITVTNGTTNANAYTFDPTKWYAITLVYSSNKLSLYINSVLANRYNGVTITAGTNILKLSDNSLATTLTPTITFEDLRVYSNAVSYQTIYEYSSGL